MKKSIIFFLLSCLLIIISLNQCANLKFPSELSENRSILGTWDIDVKTCIFGDQPSEINNAEFMETLVFKKDGTFTDYQRIQKESEPDPINIGAKGTYIFDPVLEELEINYDIYIYCGIYQDPLPVIPKLSCVIHGDIMVLSYRGQGSGIPAEPLIFIRII